jgi:alpha-L-fucosidase
MTMNGTWGFRTSDNKWKSTETLIRNLCDIASKGGNYLLNVGPKPDGSFPQESIDRLKQIGEWTKVNGEAIYATKRSPLAPLSWGRCTQKQTNKGTTLYFSVFEWPKDGKLVIPGLKNKVVSAKMLAGGATLTSKKSGNALTINVPAQAPDAIASVIKVELKGKVKDVTVDKNGKMKSGELD